MSRTPRTEVLANARRSSQDSEELRRPPSSAPRGEPVVARPDSLTRPPESREPGHRAYEPETRILEAVGAFRVVPERDLLDDKVGVGAGQHDLRRLTEAGLVEKHTIVVNHRPTTVVVLTRQGKAQIDRQASDRSNQPQQHYVGLVKPRELGHDAQVYRLFQAEATRIEAEGGRISRVVLDYELKRDYQTFLNRTDRPTDSRFEDELHRFAEAHDLPIVDGHLELPDLRIEYETADGRAATRDVELVTEHYSRAQLAGKAQSGFALYRAAGAGRLGRSSGSTTGGTPFDPHTLEWLK